MRLDHADEVGVDAKLPQTGTRVAIGVRPEKIGVGAPQDGSNVLRGTVFERAYIGVSTQLIVDTPAGRITVYLQNTTPGAVAAQPGDSLTLSWGPESTFIVEPAEVGA